MIKNDHRFTFCAVFSRECSARLNTSRCCGRLRVRDGRGEWSPTPPRAETHRMKAGREGLARARALLVGAPDRADHPPSSLCCSCANRPDPTDPEADGRLWGWGRVDGRMLTVRGERKQGGRGIGEAGVCGRGRARERGSHFAQPSCRVMVLLWFRLRGRERSTLVAWSLPLLLV